MRTKALVASAAGGSTVLMPRAGALPLKRAPAASAATASRARWLRARIVPSQIASCAVAVAMLSSAIVFSEPAVADALMAGVIAIVPLTASGRTGAVSLFNLLIWAAIVALGVAGCAFSATFDTAIKHQLVTGFLAAGAFVIATYVAADPEPRFRMIMWCYTASCVAATVCAFAGYFRMVPEAYELFTNYGRARGTFKDPNVYSAALVPALSFMLWNVLRTGNRPALVSAGIAMFLAAGLLISFSRGAWFVAAVSGGLIVWILCVRSRRKSDYVRLAGAGLLGVLLTAGGMTLLLQVDAVSDLLDQRASLDQSYDNGPEGRFGGQQKARNLVLANPFGIGTHTFRDVYHHEEPHNVYLSTFLNAGWAGGVLYIASVLSTALLGLRYAFKNGYRQGAFVVAGATFFALVLEGYIIDSDHWRHFFLLMGCLWGLADAELQLWPGTLKRRG